MTDDSTGSTRAGAPVLLDGDALAAVRAPALRARAGSVTERRGRPPRLLLLAFAGAHGTAPWISGKLRACADAGVRVHPLVLPHDAETTGAVAAFDAALVEARADAVFVQFPFPDAIDAEAICARIPQDADIDVMHPASVEAFLSGDATRPPLTIAAACALLDAHGIDVAGRSGRIVGDGTPFDRMFAAVLARREARMSVAPLAGPEHDLDLQAAALVVTSVGRPGEIRAADLAPGAVVIDGGYFNPGGIGDVDVTGGIDHLAAFAPVPGGLGPMTVSALVEAVIDAAERGRLRN